MSEFLVDVRGQTCPVPLVETRKAIRKAAPGDVIRILGTHPSSREEVPMAADSMGLRYDIVTRDDVSWEITIYR